MYTTLQANILALLATSLPDHTQLPYGIDVDLNKSGKATKGYAVILQDSKLADSSVVGRLALNTTIQVRLSDTYSFEGKNDGAQLTTSHTLADRCIAVFKDLEAAKLGSAGVRNVSLLDISEPTYIDESKIVYRTLTIEANLRA